MDPTTASLLAGLAGVVLGGLLGAAGTAWAHRLSKSRDDRRRAYEAWLQFGFRLPYVTMTSVRSAGVDESVGESIQADLAELVAMINLDGSRRVRGLIADEWPGVTAAHQELMAGHAAGDALEIAKSAHGQTIQPFLMKAARLMAKELHGRWRGR